MLNLLGCSKDNFINLIKKMDYKIVEINKETFFKYIPAKKAKKRTPANQKSDNPFKALTQLNLK